MACRRLLGQGPDLFGSAEPGLGGLRALAERAGTTAQNFNNLLAAILNATEGLKGQLEPDHPARRNFDAVHQALMGARTQGCTAAPRTRPGTRTPILLAEAGATPRTLLRAWLLKAGYQVRVAKDGQEAWEAFLEEGARCGLVVTDHLLPGLDGLELSAKIRERDVSVPILFLTSTEGPEVFKEALRAQVDEVLVKPFEAQLLVDTVNRLALARPGACPTPASADGVQEGLFTLLEPSGGLFLAFPREDGTIFFTLASAHGHDDLSISAGAAFQALLAKVQAAQPDLRTLALWCNRSIQAGPCQQVPIHALFATWVPRRGRLHLLSAGMPRPLWHRAAGGRTLPLPIGGTPLGLLGEPRIEEKVVWLRQGDRVLLGNEGFSAALDGAGAPGGEGAASVLGSLAATAVPQALELMVEAARARGSGEGLQAVVLEQPALFVSPEEIAFSLPSDPRVLDEACNVLGTFLDARGWLVDSDRFATLMAVREALTNAICHGNAGLEGAGIHIRAQRPAGGGFQVQVLDECLGFDLEAFRTSMGAGSGGEGGVALIRQFTRRVTMVGGELTMTFS